jgi:hypothetical protein
MEGFCAAGPGRHLLVLPGGLHYSPLKDAEQMPPTLTVQTPLQLCAVHLVGEIQESTFLDESTTVVLVDGCTLVPMSHSSPSR